MITITAITQKLMLIRVDLKPRLYRKWRVKPRWLAKWIANLFGYFWLPCPICSESFAGFENGPSLYLGNGSGRGVCTKKACGVEAEKRNAAFKEETVVGLDGVERLVE